LKNEAFDLALAGFTENIETDGDERPLTALKLRLLALVFDFCKPEEVGGSLLFSGPMAVLKITSAFWSIHFWKGIACIIRPSNCSLKQSTENQSIPISFCLVSYSAKSFKVTI
jgi:hypothetical protein